MQPHTGSKKPSTRELEGDVDTRSAAVLLVVAAILSLCADMPNSSGTLGLGLPLVTGSVWSVTVQLWDWVTDSWEDLDWFDAELHIVSEVIAALEPYGGVTVEDADGNDLDPDALPNPNAPDHGVDCVICIDQSYYDTERGFQWIRTRIANIVEKILEDL